MSNPHHHQPITEAEALAAAVEALRAAGLDVLADSLERFPNDAFAVMRDTFERGDKPEDWPAIRAAFGVLFAVRAGYHVTPPLHADALPGGDPPPPPPPHGGP